MDPQPRTQSLKRNTTFSCNISVEDVKDHSVTEAMTNDDDDVGLVSHAQYIAIQWIKYRKFESYHRVEVSF